MMIFWRVSSKCLMPKQTYLSYCTRLYSQYVEGKAPYNIRTEPPWRIVFFGTDNFSLPHLQALNENRLGGVQKVVSHLEVVTPSLKCPVGRYSHNHGLQIHGWPCPVMYGRFDVGVVVSFGHLIPHKVINMFPYAILNVHPSLLPRWRGASPVIHTVLNGDAHTGISIMEIRPDHFDVGPLLLQAEYHLPEQCTAADLSASIAQEGAQLLLETLSDLPHLERTEHEQDEDGVTYAHKVTLKNSQLNWERQTVDEIDRQYRALADMYELRTEWQGLPVRLRDMVSPQDMSGVIPALERHFPEDKVCPRPGLPFYDKASQTLCIRCKNGWVGWRNIVLKKPMTALAFHNGYLTKNYNRGVVFTSKENELDRYTFRTSAALQNLRAAVR